MSYPYGVICAQLAPWDETFSLAHNRNGPALVVLRPRPPVVQPFDPKPFESIQIDEVVLRYQRFVWPGFLGKPDEVVIYTTEAQHADVVGRIELFVMAMRLVKWIYRGGPDYLLHEQWTKDLA